MRCKKEIILMVTTLAVCTVAYLTAMVAMTVKGLNA